MTTSTIQETEPEFNARNTVRCTSFYYNGNLYTISTARLSGIGDYALQRYADIVTKLGDAFEGNTSETGKDYETMLFLNGEPAKPPFGDLRGNETQGLFQRYDTREEAEIGHETFTDRVKRILTQEQ